MRRNCENKVCGLGRLTLFLAPALRWSAWGKGDIW